MSPPLPLPLSGVFPFPVLPFVPGPTRPTNPQFNTLFDVTPSELDQVVRTWREQGRTVGSLEFAGMRDVHGDASDVMAALRGCATPAHDATTSIRDRIDDMATVLSHFVSSSVDSDTASAGRFDRMAER